MVLADGGLKRGPWGGSIRKDMFVDSGYKVYEQKNVINNNFSLGHYYIDDAKFRELETFAVQEGDILISAAGTIGKIAQVPKSAPPGVINQALLRIRLLQENILDRFFIFYFSYYVSRGTMQNWSHGATLKNLSSIKVLRGLPIVLPPVAEQRRIAHVLGTIQWAIEAQEVVLAAARELKRSLMHRLFTYGPYAEELPTKETEIGEIPVDWKTLKLGDIISIPSGKGFKKKEYTGVRLLRINNVSFGRIIWEDIAFLPNHYLDEHADLVLQEGDILLALNRPILGNKVKVGRLKDSDAPSILYQRVGRIRIKNEQWTKPGYLYALFQTDWFYKTLRSLL
ncbi:MAG: restriction endonuclease subunit S, partial [Planctomycetota bacterium]